ncbi:hypothetical protein BDQ17DRAFT_1242408, partial [Cyathus striatus]
VTIVSVAVTILHVTGITTACLRIYYRHRSRRIWWDDYAAVPPALSECLNVMVLWARLQHFGIYYNNVFIMSFRDLTRVLRWSRISMGLAIIRIMPEWSKSRVISLCVTSAFILNWTALVTAFTVICSLHTDWEFDDIDYLICSPAYAASAASIATDIVGDVFLAALPLYRLWSLRLPPGQRRLVRLVFSTSLLPLIVAIFLFILTYGGITKGPGSVVIWTMMIQIEVSSTSVLSYYLISLDVGSAICYC